jgi:hypothetical protein
MIQLDKAHKKLQKEHKEVQSKHEQLCSNFRTLKFENESSLKERNRLSVALQASKKAFDSKQKAVDEEVEVYKAELKKLNEFKILKLEESRKVKKQEKKLRQTEKKIASKKDDELDINDNCNASTENAVIKIMIQTLKGQVILVL